MRWCAVGTDEDLDGDELRSARRAERRRRTRQWRWLALAVVAIAAAAAAIAIAAGIPGSRPAHPGASTLRSAGDGVAHGGVRSRRFKRSGAPVPILIYHVIAKPIPNAPFPGLYVPAAAFAAQMQALAAAGFHAVTLNQMRAAWRGRAALPNRPIVISFDNGYRTQYTQALPILRRLGWVGDENLQLTGLPPSQGGLSTREVRALVRAGWELDTQGKSHADLNTLDQAQLRLQIAATRHVLQRRYRVRVDWFCYPSGHYNAAVVAAVRRAGFAGSTTVVPGWARPSEDPFRLPRLRVLDGTTPGALLDEIAGTQMLPPPPAVYPPGA